MLGIIVLMLAILVLASAVAAYVAFPRRGAELPYVPVVGVLLARGVEALPTLDNRPGNRRGNRPGVRQPRLWLDDRRG